MHGVATTPDEAVTRRLKSPYMFFFLVIRVKPSKH